MDSANLDLPTLPLCCKYLDPSANLDSRLKARSAKGIELCWLTALQARLPNQLTLRPKTIRDIMS
jgi:hypothetical protein